MSKKIALIAVVIMMIGIGSVKANERLQPLVEWHNKQFVPISEELGAVTAVGLLKTVKTTSVIIKESKFGFSLAMAELSGDNTALVIHEIEKYEQQMQFDLTVTKEELKKQNFEGYKERLSIERTVTDEVDQILAEVLED